MSGVLLLIVYYLYFFTGFKKLGASSTKPMGPVSVVIAARNERENLSKNLPAILKQKYDYDFEVVVVNDGSFDGSKDFLENLAKEHANLKVVTLEIDERFQKGKKFALTIGIKAATHEHLLLTDADCMPSSDLWIQSMSSTFEDKQIVLGYAPLKVRMTPLGSLISYETFHTAIQYFGYARRQKTYMGVGRNLAYTKELFFGNKGFATHQHIMSGDDDLFIQEVASKTNVAINVDRDAFTFSPAPKGVSKWIKQKVRHLSTSKEYKTSIKLLLGFYSFLQLLTYLCL
ncbi:MAG: glycosyltransferase, partial [Bacteroidia bacterium]